MTYDTVGHVILICFVLIVFTVFEFWFETGIGTRA